MTYERDIEYVECVSSSFGTQMCYAEIQELL